MKAVTRLLGRRGAWRVGRSLYMHGREDLPNFMELNGEQLMQSQFLYWCASNNIRPVIFDVGANIGKWTASLLRISEGLAITPTLDIHCFEPVPPTFEMLKAAIGALDATATIHFLQQALSREEGNSNMYIVGEMAGTNSLHRSDGSGFENITVNVTSADAYCEKNNIPTIHYFKCDAEGHDGEVLMGAMQMLREQRIMTFQLEYNYRWIYARHYLRDVFAQIKDLPYRLGKITPTAVEIYENWHPELERFFEGNYVLIHDQALSWYSTRIGRFDESNTYCT